MKMVLKIFNHLITYLLMAALLLLAFIVISSKASGGEPQAFGYQLKSVLSGSMEPTFQTGSIIAVKPVKDQEQTRFKKGDIITFQTEEEKLITHRIVKVSKPGGHVMYETKGDNNNAVDLEPVMAANVVAKYEGFTIPYIGYFTHFASTPKGAAILMITPGVLLLIYAGYVIVTALREIDKRTPRTEEEISISE